VVHVWLEGAKRFGGLISLIMSMLVELLVSMLLAPIRMLFHTQFVVAALTGWSIQWKSPPREDTATPWIEAFRRHGLHTLLGLVWAGGVYWLNPSFLWWLLPVVGALILSIPISVYSSRVSLGRFMKKLRLFIIPEEAQLPQELRWVQQNIRMSQDQHGFVDAVTDPVVNALACMFGVSRPRQARTISNYRLRLAHTALEKGPAALSGKQKMLLLNDPSALSYLHFNVWTSDMAHPGWSPTKLEPGLAKNVSTGRISPVPVLAG
jgi:membrane glycosyltransferase